MFGAASMTELRNINVELRRFKQRTWVAGALVLVAFGLLSLRLVTLQVLRHERLSEQAESNRTTIVPVVPHRGWILDRNGVVLASNYSAYTLEITPVETGSDNMDELIAELAKIVLIEPRDIRRFKKLLGESKNFESIPLRSRLNDEEVARLTAQRYRFPGVEIQARLFRSYPLGETASHVVGYIGRINQQEKEMLADMEPGIQANYKGTDYIGKLGIEQSFEKNLHGQAGVEQVETSAGGRATRQLGATQAKPGDNIVLSIDIKLQKMVEDMFGDRRGALVAIDPNSGEVLAFVSKPTFDPNLFVEGVPSRMYRALADYERRPLTDKAMTGTFAPGSTFKPVVGLAALKRGVSPDRRIVCTGGYYLGRRFACLGRHGAQDMRSAIKNSCNVYFMTLAVEMGPDAVAQTARDLGFGQTFDIGIDGQKKGLVPDTQWRRENPVRGDGKWYPGETPSYAIGQGALTVNALQLAVYTSRIANGQKAVVPRLIKSIGGVEQAPGAAFADLPYDAEWLKILREGMEAVTDVGGTGFRNSQLGLGPIRMAGKTGTAQARNYGAGSRKGAGRPWEQKDHNLFIAYAPTDAPRYAVAVIVQHGGLGGGTAGAPRAREVMRVALLKDPEIRARLEQSGLAGPAEVNPQDAQALEAGAATGTVAPTPAPTPDATPAPDAAPTDAAPVVQAPQ